ncbi:MAG: SufD family Fe-S cluster assembly protein [Tumebacillaceae bacterium]
MSAESHVKDLVKRLVCHRLEPDWLRDCREQALTVYETLPEPVFEKSDLRKRRTGPFSKTKTPLPCPELLHLREPFQSHTTSRMVYSNETITEHALQPDLAQQGVLFTDLSLAVRIFPRLVQPYLGKALPPNADRWVALNGAIWNAGLFLYVPKNVQITLPLQAWWTRTIGGGQLHPRLLVVAEENSSVTLLAGEMSELEEDAFSTFTAEVFAKQGARVRIALLQEQSAQMTRLAYLRARVDHDAQVDWLFADGGTGYTVADVTSMLEEDGGASTLHGLALGSESQHLDLTLRTEHRGRHTTSDIKTRALLTGRAKTISRAVSAIAKGAVGTNSTQEERIMLLDKTAQAHPIPMLLIAEEDVRCDHAVSVGSIPADPLFYLMARGLTQADAKHLLLQSFLHPVLAPIPGLEDALHGWLERRITR